ncbi:MAG: tRNA lysidine(34) synthetase TilS [Firmicutes bacterium]|nr:tRNA lysidine(34) synthetase TilS [Bacillota bacterium]
MLEQVRQTLRRYGMVQPGDRVLVAVSGGPDSTALALALARLAPEWGFSLHLFHLHHGLRGEAADEDARWVEALAASLGLPCTIRRVDVRALAQAEGKGLEAAGRQARYQELARLAGEVGANRVATGHTRDDQAETVLLRLLRGTGPGGLAGIRPVRPLGPPAPPGTTVIRPLLEVSRRETEAFCAAAGIVPRWDATNLTPDFTRNRVRHELLPLLRQFNPAIVDRLAELAEVAREEDDHLAAATAEAAAAWGCRLGEEEASLPLAALRQLPIALGRRLIRLAAAGFGVCLPFRHVEALLRGAREGKGCWDLPGGLTAAVGPEALILRRRTPGGTPADPGPDAKGGPLPQPVPLAVPGETEVPELGVSFRAEWVDAPGGGPAAPDSVDLAPERLPGPLAVRTWRPGDRIYPVGMSGSKKLQDLFVDSKVPRARRSRIPLVVAGDAVVWVVGLRVDRRFLAGPEGPRLRLTVQHRGTNPTP